MTSPAETAPDDDLLLPRVDHARVARQFRAPGDPTTIVLRDELWRATVTPDGPATVHVRWAPTASVRAWGPGADWLVERVPGMLGRTDRVVPVSGVHPVVDRAEHRHPFLRIARSGALYHDILPTVIGQRITGREAAIQWRRLCTELGGPVPGPNQRLRLPPTPDALAGRPAWWFHRLGIEARRAEALRTVGRHADRMLAAGGADCDDAASMHDWLQRLPGIGAWTAGVVAGIALGHPDEIPVGDFHLKNQVVHALTGRARGTDDEMLELLEPWAGQRNRVVLLLLADGARAPSFGPRQRILPMHRW